MVYHKNLISLMGVSEMDEGILDLFDVGLDVSCIHSQGSKQKSILW